MWRDELARLLKKDFAALKQKNPRFSQAAYAKLLDVSAATVSQILSGKIRWQITSARAVKIVEKMKITPSQKKRVLTLLDAVPDVQREPLQPSSFGFLTNWTFSAIQTCHALPKKHRNPEAIAHRLGLTAGEVNKVIGQLKELKMLMESEEGLVPSQPHWGTGDGPPSKVIQAHHQEMAKVAMRGLAEIPAAHRNFSSVVFTGNAEQLEKARAEIIKFEDRLMAIMDQDEHNNEIYQMSISLFPLHFTGHK